MAKKSSDISFRYNATLWRLWVEMMAWTGDPVGESQSEIFDCEALTTCWRSLLEVYISCYGVRFVMLLAIEN